jgi:hypothetical protein
MVRTYWLVPVFNEASGNLDLQLSARRPNRCLSAPCYVGVNSTRASPTRLQGQQCTDGEHADNRSARCPAKLPTIGAARLRLEVTKGWR